jgi:hypothetical protein
MSLVLSHVKTVAGFGIAFCSRLKRVFALLFYHFICFLSFYAFVFSRSSQVTTLYIYIYIYIYIC